MAKKLKPYFSVIIHGRNQNDKQFFACKCSLVSIEIWFLVIVIRIFNIEAQCEDSVRMTSCPFFHTGQVDSMLIHVHYVMLLALHFSARLCTALLLYMFLELGGGNCFEINFCFC